MKTATPRHTEHVEPEDGGTHHTAVYHMQPPYEGHAFVLVSARYWSGIIHETAIYACTEAGEVTDLDVLLVVRGTLDHAAALSCEGYEIASTEVAP